MRTRSNSNLQDEPITHHIHTFDSGIGGMFTAYAIRGFIQSSMESEEDNTVKELAQRGHFFKVTHFGDTKNAPYGYRSNEEIRALTSNAVNHSLNEGADLVFIACNTASTQYDGVKEDIGEEKASKVISIIDQSTQELINKTSEALEEGNDKCGLSIFSTKATINSRVYPKDYLKKLKQDTRFADAQIKQHYHRSPFNDDNEGRSYTKTKIGISSSGEREKIIYLNQYAPHPWVTSIENGMENEEKQQLINKDIKSYVETFGKQTSPTEPIGLFCTHYPALEGGIKEAFEDHERTPSFITQGDLMQQVFEERLKDDRYQKLLREPKRYGMEACNDIYNKKCQTITYNITGENIAESQESIRNMFGDEGISIEAFSYDTPIVGAHTASLLNEPHKTNHKRKNSDSSSIELSTGKRSRSSSIVSGASTPTRSFSERLNITDSPRKLTP